MDGRSLTDRQLTGRRGSSGMVGRSAARSLPWWLMPRATVGGEPYMPDLEPCAPCLSGEEPVGSLERFAEATGVLLAVAPDATAPAS